MEGIKKTLVPHTPPVVWAKDQLTVSDIMNRVDSIRAVQRDRNRAQAKDMIDTLMRDIVNEISQGCLNPQPLAAAGRIAYDTYYKRSG